VVLIFWQFTPWQWSPGMKVNSLTRPPQRQSKDPQRNVTSFSREEFECLATFNSTSKGDHKHGDRLLEWASNPVYNPNNFRPFKMNTLQKYAADEHVPDGLLHEDFTDPSGLDGAQRLMFYGRSLYETCKELLRNVRFAGSQYEQAEVMYDGLGKRKLGALNRGEMYESCQSLAGSRVSPVPVFLSSDTTVICKKMGGHPIIGESWATV
jgi:hypothetical protein